MLAPSGVKEERQGMECPHCGSTIEATPHKFALGIDQKGTWQVSNTRCPTCDQLVVAVCSAEGANYPAYPPTGSSRAKLSEDVPADLADEYWTASMILPYSEEASAAISRRLLQRILSVQAGAGYGGLAEQVGRAIDSPAMPPYLKEALATLVKVAKLQPGESKSYRCEALAPVNDGEAEWLLEVLRPLFDFYYVEPARVRRKRFAMEERIAPPAAEEESGELEEEEGDDGWAKVEEEPEPEAPPEKQPVKEPVREPQQ
jgi:hypothetical protein